MIIYLRFFTPHLPKIIWYSSNCWNWNGIAGCWLQGYFLFWRSQWACRISKPTCSLLDSGSYSVLIIYHTARGREWFVVLLNTGWVWVAGAKMAQLRHQVVGGYQKSILIALSALASIDVRSPFNEHCFSLGRLSQGRPPTSQIPKTPFSPPKWTKSNEL